MYRVMFWVVGVPLISIMALIGLAVTNDYLRKNTAFDFIIEATGTKLKCTSDKFPTAFSLTLNLPLKIIKLDTIEGNDTAFYMDIVKANDVKIESEYNTMEFITLGSKFNKTYLTWLQDFQDKLVMVKREMSEEQDAGEPWVRKAQMLWHQAAGRLVLDRTTGAGGFFEDDILWPEKGLKKPFNAPERFSRKQDVECVALEKSF